MAKSISSFKEKLKILLFFRVNNIFNQESGVASRRPAGPGLQITLTGKIYIGKLF